jgi:hypothetical protein
MIRPVNGNQLRDTPGRMMLLWAVCCLPVVVFAWRVHLGRGQFDWAEYPTALGDTQYYANSAMIGENDFFEPNLKFFGQEKGLYRRTFQPRQRNDEDMVKVAKDATDRFFVYTEARSGKSKDGSPVSRHYLKSGENAFIEFGARKYYPEYTVPGSLKRPVPDVRAKDE